MKSNLENCLMLRCPLCLSIHLVILVDLISKLTLDLIDDTDLSKRRHFSDGYMFVY